MVQKKEQIVIFFLSFILLANSIFAEEKLGATMPDSYCRVSCYDEEDKDTTYTVSLDAKAWVDSADLNSCGLDIYERYFKDEILVHEERIRYLDPAEERRSYGGYLSNDHSGTEDEEHFIVGIISGFLGKLKQQDIIWKLLYSGYVYITNDDGIITSSYTHRINGCPVGTYVQLDAMCATHDEFDDPYDKVAIGCYVYKQGELEPYSSGDLDFLSIEGEVDRIYESYTHFVYCAEEDGCDDIKEYQPR